MSAVRELAATVDRAVAFLRLLPDDVQPPGQVTTNGPNRITTMDWYGSLMNLVVIVRDDSLSWHEGSRPGALAKLLRSLPFDGETVPTEIIAAIRRAHQ